MKKLIRVGILALLAGAFNTQAGYRPFTYTYDTYPMGQGNFELEQWVTLKRHTGEDSGYSRWDFREEIEYGVTDNLRLALYLPKWQVEDSRERNGARFDQVSLEAIYLLSNPVTDAIGVGLYGEVGLGERGEVESEFKLLLHKDVGAWTLAYNLIAETGVENVGRSGDHDVEGVLGHSLGLSYVLGKSWRLGGEAVVETILEDWRRYDHTTVYAGPAISYMGGNFGRGSANWWISVTPTFQLTSRADEPDYVTRMIAGLSF
jgi:hypothetical protein